MTPETYMKHYHGADADTLEGYAPRPCGAAANQDCGCNQNCGCGQDCGCNQNCPMARALGLLTNSELTSLVDFDAFFFLTDSLAVGSALGVPSDDDTDNIGDPAASLERFAPNSSALVDVDGTAYFAIPGSSDVALDPVEQLNVCALEAVAFDLEELDCTPECPDSVYRWAVRALRNAIEECGGETGGNCPCGNGGCRCNADMVEELSSLNLSRTVTLTVDGLVLSDVTVIGSMDTILILASEEIERIYFVDTRHVEAIG